MYDQYIYLQLYRQGDLFDRGTILLYLLPLRQGRFVQVFHLFWFVEAAHARECVAVEEYVVRARVQILLVHAHLALGPARIVDDHLPVSQGLRLLGLESHHLELAAALVERPLCPQFVAQYPARSGGAAHKVLAVGAAEILPAQPMAPEGRLNAQGGS